MNAHSEFSDDEAKALEQARILRLKIIVIALGVILVILALAVFSTLIWRAVKGRSGAVAPAASVQASRPAGPTVAIGDGAARAVLPRNGRIVATALGDGRLAVTVEDGDTVTTILFDAATLAETGRIAWERAP